MRLTRDGASRRLALAGLGSGAALAACGRISGAGGKDRPLRVGTYRGGVETYFTPAGLAPGGSAPAEFASGNLIAEAINAGALDLGSMSEIPPVFAAARPGPLRLVAVLRGDVNNQVILVPKASSVRSIADLRGARVGYVKATTAQYFLLRALGEVGLGFKDIRPVALSPQDGLAAFGQGALDAWVIFGVQSVLARVRFGARVLTTALGRLSGNYLYAAHADLLKDDHGRARLATYLGKVRQAYAWAEAHPADAAGAVAAATGVPAAVYLQQRAERSGPTLLGPISAPAIQSLQSVADVFARAGVIPAAVNTAPLWDHALDTDLGRDVPPRP